MNNEIEILDRYYQSFINQKRDWDFFLGLADYVKYAVETPEVNNILKYIIQAQNNDQKRLEKYEQAVIEETKQAKKKLFKIIKKHKISYESLDRAIEEYQGYENGRILSSQTEAEALSNALMDVIRNLFNNNYKELVKDFAIEHKEIPNEVGKYTFSKTLNLYKKEKEIFKEKLETELWASWDNLTLVYSAVFKANEELEKLQQDKKDFFKAWNFLELTDEIKKIRDDDMNRRTGIASNFKPIYFKRENYTIYATRIHNYLIQELSKKEVEKQEKKAKETEKEHETKETPPTKIEITNMPELQVKGLKEIANMRQKDDRPKFPHKLPAGTRWEEIMIKFENNEKVFIKVKQFREHFTYKDMGFIGRGKNPNPSEAWIFLKVLAQVNGELTIKDTEVRDKYKKQKELLAKALQSYFSLDYDPFYPYRSSSEKQGNSYKIKITLIPPPDKKGKTYANKDNNNDLGIEEEYKRQTPEVYDEYQ